MGVQIDCEVKEGADLNIKILLENNIHQQQWIKIRTILLDSEIVCTEKFVCLNQHTAGNSVDEISFTISTENMKSGKHELIVLAESNAKVSRIAIPLTVIKK